MKKIEKTNRNNMIDILKLLFCFIIVFLHITRVVDGFDLFTRGLLAVDFFFIVSGYFFANSMRKEIKKDSDIYEDNVKFIIKKYMYFFPYILVGFIIGLLYRIIIEEVAIHTILNSVFTLLLVQMAGLPMAGVNSVTWYVSVLLISMFIIYPMLRKNEKKYVNYIAPIFVVLGYGIFNHIFKNFVQVLDYKTFIYNGLVRGFLDVNIGIILYNILKDKNYILSSFKKLLLSLVEIVGYAFLVFLMYKSYVKLDLFTIVVWVIVLSITLSNTSYLDHILNKIKLPVGELSTAMFFLHLPLIYWSNYYITKYFQLDGMVVGFIIFGIIIVFSSLFLLILNIIKKRFRSN